MPLQQQYVPRLAILARSVHGERLAAEIRELLAAIDPRMPVVSVQTLDDQGGPVQTQLRVAASVSGGVGVIGLLLASIGLYGVTAYSVTRRTREIGIRLALGARPGDVVRMVLWRGLALVAAGSLIGLALALAADRLLTRLFFGLPTVDSVTFVETAALFTAIGLAACYLPGAPRDACRCDDRAAIRVALRRYPAYSGRKRCSCTIAQRQPEP